MYRTFFVTLGQRGHMATEKITAASDLFAAKVVRRMVQELGMRH